jgi:hypothetical protein
MESYGLKMPVGLFLNGLVINSSKSISNDHD